ncbi:uncharacterized protein [Dysidea avara]|uniref:uncharacterized protein isoform X1 n=1 Tax=Dysidea avara TaxID=196820 RepID=UPI003329E742
MLITVMIADDHGQGYPVAWCISSQETTEVVQLLFQVIKDRSPNVKVRTLMTDDDDIWYNGSKAVFGNEILHLLCHWHVDRSWKNHLRSVAKEHQLNIYQTLCILVHEVDRSLFTTRMTQFTEYWNTREPNFVKYFNTYYKERADKWARCYRHFSHADTDTNMYLESFHAKLKTNYLNGKVNRRVDFLIDALLRIEQDCFFKVAQKQRLGTINKQEVKEAHRHKRGLQIKAEDVTDIDDNH